MVNPRESGWRSTLRERLPGLVLEAASVVFAVLLALGVDEWRENRVNEALADRARDAVIEEVRANLDELRDSLPENEALQRNIHAWLGAEEEPTEIAIDFSVAILSSAAWRAAQATQAVHYMEFEQVMRISTLYETQELYLGSQAAVVDVIGSLGEIADSGPRPMLRRVSGRLNVIVDLQRGLIENAENVLDALGTGPG